MACVDPSPIPLLEEKKFFDVETEESSVEYEYCCGCWHTAEEDVEEDKCDLCYTSICYQCWHSANREAGDARLICTPCYHRDGFGSRRCGCWGSLVVTKAVDGTPNQWICFNCREACCYSCVVYRAGIHREDLCETCWVNENQASEDTSVMGKRTAVQDQKGVKRRKLELVEVE